MVRDMRTRDGRALSASAQEVLRRTAVKAVRNGKTHQVVAALLGVRRQVVGRWVGRARNGGLPALKARRRGRPPGGTLRPWQAAQIAKALVDRHPDQLKLPFYLWTREAVAQLIEQRFGLRLSVWTVGRYLARWGFTPQKPIRRAYEQNPAAVRRWLRRVYPAIRAMAHRERATIFWEDETGMRSDHQAGTSYGRRGHTPVIPGTGQRFRCNMLSAITNRGRLNFMVFKQRFTAPVFLDFLRRLVRQTTRKIFLIVDGHPVHRSGRVTQWQRQHAQRLRLFFLPGYSPELNPDEMLNQDVKANAVGRQRPHNQAELLRNVRGHLRSRQRRPQIVRRYFQAPHVRYAAG